MEFSFHRISQWRIESIKFKIPQKPRRVSMDLQSCYAWWIINQVSENSMVDNWTSTWTLNATLKDSRSRNVKRLPTNFDLSLELYLKRFFFNILVTKINQIPDGWKIPFFTRNTFRHHVILKGGQVEKKKKKEKKFNSHLNPHPHSLILVKLNQRKMTLLYGLANKLRNNRKCLKIFMKFPTTI